MKKSKAGLSDEAKMWLLIAAILLVGGVIFGLFAWSLYKLQWWAGAVPVGFVLWFLFAGWLAERSNNGVMKVISAIISAPVSVVFIALELLKPFITIVFTYFFVFLFSFGVLFLVLNGVSSVFDLELLLETICFLALSIGSIICSTFYAITKWVVKISPNRNWEEHKYESYREQLSIYLIQPNNVVLLLYVAYFVFLVVTGYLQIQKGSYLISQSYDAAVLKAFLVFIAYTNMRTKWRDAEMDAKLILGQTLRLFGFE